MRLYTAAMATVAHAVVPFANQRQDDQNMATKHVMSFMLRTSKPPPGSPPSSGQISAC